MNYLDGNEYSQGVAFLAKALRTDPTYWPAATRLISVLTDRGFPLDILPPIKHELPIYDHVLNTGTGLLVTRGPSYDMGKTVQLGKEACSDCSLANSLNSRLHWPRQVEDS